MAHRLPIVASAVAVEGTGLVEEHGYLAAEDPVACAAAILRLLDDPARAARLAENALGVLRERFSPEVFGRRLDLALDPFLPR